MGAPYPDGADNTGQSRTRVIDIEAGRKLWAYQLPRMPVLPDVKDRAWPSADLDRFTFLLGEDPDLPETREQGRLRQVLHRQDP